MSSIKNEFMRLPHKLEDVNLNIRSRTFTVNIFHGWGYNDCWTMTLAISSEFGITELF